MHPSNAATAVPTRTVTRAAALDPDFEARWTAWKIAGQKHERAGRRKLALAILSAAVASLIYVVFQ